MVSRYLDAIANVAHLLSSQRDGIHQQAKFCPSLNNPHKVVLLRGYAQTSFSSRIHSLDLLFFFDALVPSRDRIYGTVVVDHGRHHTHTESSWTYSRGWINHEVAECIHLIIARLTQ